jgi:catechol 2,3-dioxygenase-like lactoylglutathione lyase family enzyme
MATFDPAFTQLGYVTTDIDAAIAYFTRTAGVSAWLRWPGVVVEKEVNGAMARSVLDLAMAWRGSTMLELIRPVSGAIGIYTLRGAEDAPVNLHHIGHGVPGDESAFERQLEAMAAAGHPVALATRNENGNYALVDTRSTTGLYTEYLWGRAKGNALFETIPRNEIFYQAIA